MEPITSQNNLLKSKLILQKKQNIRNFLNSSIQYGHKSTQWNPKMAPYILTEKQSQHIFDLAITSKLLFKAGHFCKKVAQKQGKFLFVGTSKTSSKIVPEIAISTNSYYINYRWIGGLLTNWLTIQKQMAFYKTLVKDFSNQNYSSKKAQIFGQKRLDRLKKLFDGIKDMEKIPDVVIFTDQKREYLAIQECIRLGIPTICVVDSNGDPDLNSYLIPGNDDSRASVNYILKYLKSKIIAGQKAGK